MPGKDGTEKWPKEAASRLAAVEASAECHAAELHTMRRRLFQLEQQIGAAEKAVEHTDQRLGWLQLALILAAGLSIGGYCLLRVYGLTGVLIGGIAAAGIGALMYFDEK